MSATTIYNSKLSLESRQLNAYYLSRFRDSKHPNHNAGRREFTIWSQYKTTLTKFLDELGKPLYSIEENDIFKFTSAIKNEATRRNKIKHIKALLVFLIQEDEEFFERLTKEQVLWILQMKP